MKVKGVEEHGRTLRCLRAQAAVWKQCKPFQAPYQPALCGQCPAPPFANQWHSAIRQYLHALPAHHEQGAQGPLACWVIEHA